MAKSDFFNSYFETVVSPVEIVLFNCLDPIIGFECFYSSSSEYIVNDYYSLYNLSPLLRVLLLKEEIASEEIIEKIYEIDSGFFCKILHWSQFQKRVVFVKVEDRTIFEQEGFVKKINDLDILNRAYAGQYSQRAYE